MKTEKEKMLAGESYDCSDPELIGRWHEAKKWMRAHSLADTTDRALIDSLRIAWLPEIPAR